MLFRCVLFVLCLAPALAQRAPLFKDEILPILERNCTACHSAEKKMGGLDLTSFAGLMNGGGSGPAIAPGRPTHSLLWLLIESGKMPVGGKLSVAQKQTLKAYIEQGRFPKGANDAAQAAREAAKITPEARKWWSFQVPVKPPVPVVKGKGRTPIDAFILARLEEKGWKLQPEADRRTLLRRASFDLTGLPPTPAETKNFL